jgi:very-short-patch-repair endonuclease
MQYSNNNYNKNLKNFARANRKNSTKAEIKLWCELLRNRQMLGYSFLRQRPVGNFIADFYCKELKLVIETDGLSHQFEDVIKKDKEKDAYLLSVEISVLRFNDDEVMKDIENVCRTIETWIRDRSAV